MTNQKISKKAAENQLKAYGAAAFSQGSLTTVEHLLPLAQQLLKQSEALVTALTALQENSEKNLQEAKKEGVKTSND